MDELVRLEVRPGSMAEVLYEENFPQNEEEYAREGAIMGLPPPRAKFDLYAQLEASGALKTFLAFQGKLIGFINVLVTEIPHYQEPVAVCESFFVLPAHRQSGAGIKLLREGERVAQERGAKGLLVSAPFGGILAKVLPRLGYRETNEVFFKPFQPPGGLPSMTEEEISKVRGLEAQALREPQAPTFTGHLLHAGVYARSMLIPPGTLITGALIKRATSLVIAGDVLVYTGAGTSRLTGYNVIPASQDRKQAFWALSPVGMTMFFATGAASVAEAEAEFTDETDLLLTRRVA